MNPRVIGIDLGKPDGSETVPGSRDYSVKCVMQMLPTGVVEILSYEVLEPEWQPPKDEPLVGVRPSGVEVRDIDAIQPPCHMEDENVELLVSDIIDTYEAHFLKHQAGAEVAVDVVMLIKHVVDFGCYGPAKMDADGPLFRVLEQEYAATHLIWSYVAKKKKP